jgi:hypothetical protein
MVITATAIAHLGAADDENLQELRQTPCTAVVAAVFFFQTFSMLWPSVICFDLWQNTRDPRWRWDSAQRVEKAYLVVVTLASALAPFYIIGDPNKDYCRVKPGARVCWFLISRFFSL